MRKGLLLEISLSQPVHHKKFYKNEPHFICSCVVLNRHSALTVTHDSRLRRGYYPPALTFENESHGLL